MNDSGKPAPKRHCMVVHAYYPLGESRVEREANALIHSGYEVDVLCLQDAGEQAVESGEGWSIYRLPVKRGYGRGIAMRLMEYLGFFLLVFFKLLSLYPQRRYQVIQVHNLPDFLVFSAIVPKLLGASLILDLHDLMPEFFAGAYGRSFDSFPVRLVRWQERISCRFADRVITVTELWRQKLIQRGVPGEKVSVVMNVADDRVFYPLASTTQSKNGSGRFRLIYHGTLVERYGVDLLVQAVNLVRPRIPEISLVLQGAGEYYQELIDMIENLNLGNHVQINGYNIHVTELPKLIAQADAGVIPNRNDPFTDELLPTKLLEYVALNVPVIAARTQGITAHFDDSMLEFFTPGDVHSLADSIFCLYSDPQRLNELKGRANDFNQMYNWPSISANYVALVGGLSS